MFPAVWRQENKPKSLMVSQGISSHECGDQSRFFKPNLNLFLNLAKFFFMRKPNQSISTIDNWTWRNVKFLHIHGLHKCTMPMFIWLVSIFITIVIFLNFKLHISIIQGVVPMCVQDCFDSGLGCHRVYRLFDQVSFL